MSTRKRTQQALLEEQDEDELSPTKNHAREKEVLGTLKKRKLNTYGTSPSSKTLTPKGNGLLGRLGGLGGLFGFSSEKGKENVQTGELDELSGDVDMDQESEDIWDVPEEHDDTASRRKSAKGRRSTKVAQTTTNEEDIWEISVSDENDTSQSITKAKHGATATSRSVKKLREAEKEADTSPKRSAGRPKRELKIEVDTTPQRTSGKKVVVEENNTSRARTSLGRGRKSDILKKAKALSRDAIRKRMSQQGLDDEEEEPTKSDSPIKKRKGRRSKFEVADASKTGTNSAQGSRARGRPKRDLDGNLVSSKATPKGVLTPTKNREARSRKSLGFQEAIEVELGFKDIPASVTAKSPKPRGRRPKEKEIESVPDATDIESVGISLSEEYMEEEVDLEDEDDTACGICNGLDSEEPNEILFCDNCDNAYHQVCYGVPEVPEGDWLCKDCQPDVNGLLGTKRLLVDTEAPDNIPDIEGFEEHLQTMQRIILDKLAGQRRIKPTGHEEEMQKVHQVVEQTILAGEGNSMLVIGARGCGKTNLVDSIISNLSMEHREIFHVVRLNGFIHTDDKLALKEIWRQLGREMEVDDDLATKSNAADTLASLLALLSHPSEISEVQGDQTAKSVVFILDEFDLFTTHPRQTLLYNLFDIAQARKAPIVVLGLTTRVDVVEALEKRVKSRFSHRYVHLSLPRNIPAYWEICKAAFMSNSEELVAAASGVDTNGIHEFLSYWQSMIEGLYSKDNAFKHHLQSQFYRTKSVPGFFASCILPIANLSPKNLPLTGRNFASSSTSLSPPDSKLHILQGLSELELALLIAAARLDIILDTDTCNFAMAYDEYCSLTSRHKIQTSSTGMAALGASAKVWGRDIALGAWERLAGYDLLVPAGIGGGSARDFDAGGRMWKVDVGLEEITGSVDGLSGVMAKWCREI